MGKYELIVGVSHEQEQKHGRPKDLAKLWKNITSEASRKVKMSCTGDNFFNDVF